LLERGEQGQEYKKPVSKLEHDETKYANPGRILKPPIRVGKSDSYSDHAEDESMTIWNTSFGKEEKRKGKSERRK